MIKAGIIRCQQTEDICPGTTDFKIANKGILAFEETGPVELIGFVTCGGCPGKRAVSRAQEMVKRGAEAIFFASCISKGHPISFPCPHFETMKAAITKKLGPEIRIIDWTH
ncbi:MAG: CGGC domain-containing protein [Marinifilaceae bacterium]